MSLPLLQPAIPNYMVSDVAATSAFYQRLGFTEVATVPAPSGTGLQWARLQRGETTIMLQDLPSMAGDFPQHAVVATGFLIWIKLTSGLDALAAEFKAAGIPFERELHTTFYNTNEFVLKDPDGVLVVFAQYAER